MKTFKQFLLEVKDTKKNRALLRKKYGEIPEEDIGDIIDRFNSQKGRLKIKDIFSYTSLETLKSSIYSMSSSEKRKGSKGGVIDFPDKPYQNAKHIYQDDEVLVVEITSEEESKYYGHEIGRSCAWCIAYTNRQTYWEDYENRGIRFVFVIDRNGEKWALAYKPGDEYLEVFDANDNVVSHFMVINQYEQIIDPLKKHGVPVKAIKDYIGTDAMFTGEDHFILAQPKLLTYLDTDYNLFQGSKPTYVIDDHVGYKHVWLKDGKPWKVYKSNERFFKSLSQYHYLTTVYLSGEVRIERIELEDHDDEVAKDVTYYVGTKRQRRPQEGGDARPNSIRLQETHTWEEFEMTGYETRLIYNDDTLIVINEDEHVTMVRDNHGSVTFDKNGRIISQNLYPPNSRSTGSRTSAKLPEDWWLDILKKKEIITYKEAVEEMEEIAAKL